MKQKTIKVYSIKELSKEVKAKVLDKYRDFNTEFEWWDCNLENLSEEIKTKLKIDIEPSEIFFDFGNGCNIYIQSGVVVKALSFKYEELLDFDLPEKFGCFTNYMGGGMNSNLKSSDFDLDLMEFEEYDEDSQLKQVVYKKSLEQIKDKIGCDLDELHKLLDKAFRGLWEDYHYNISDESIEESLEANEFEFLENGDRC